MDIDQVAQLVETGGESETLEFKETTGTRREASRTVCAFLNQRGGQVLFGVTAAGVVAGQQVSDRTIEELSAELQRIDPPAFPTMEYRKTVLPMDPVKKNKLKIMTIERSVPEEYMYVLVDRIIGDWLEQRNAIKIKPIEQEKKSEINKVVRKTRRRKRNAK